MVQRITVTLVDDLDGTDADETVEFGLDGVAYEIDLSTDNAAVLRDTLADYLAHGRRLGRAPRAPRQRATQTTQPTRTRTRTSTRSPSPPPAPSRVDPEQHKAIRDWARAHGYTVAGRGRIPGALIEAYHRGEPSPATRISGDQSAAVPTETSEPGAAKVGRDGLTSADRERIRAWAQQEGIEVKARGQLRGELIANYKALQARNTR